MIAPRQTGWIGVDVGNATVKAVQLTRVKNALAWGESVIVPRSSSRADASAGQEEVLSVAEELTVVRSLGGGFRGRRVAASLPMSVCNVHTFDPPRDATREPPRITTRTLETVTGCPAGQLQFATWAAEPATGKDVQQVRTNLIAVATHWPDQLSADIAQAGWSCQVIDATPFCLARAVAMVAHHANETAVAALDWGYRRATFCVILAGRPVYVRCLKDCGLDRLLTVLTENLHVTPNEAQRLLRDYGVGFPIATATPHAEALIAELTAEPLRQLKEEISRTISHLNCQRRSIVPRQIQLLGGGAAIKGLAAHLASELSVDVHVWRFDGQPSQEVEPAGVPSCLFGMAAALSSLAWRRV